MATTALFHHKALPQKKYPEFATLDQPAQLIVHIPSILLCLAENLDRGHASVVRDARLYMVDTQHVVLYIDATHDCQVEVWGVQKHLTACEQAFGRPLVIKLRQRCEV